MNNEHQLNRTDLERVGGVEIIIESIGSSLVGDTTALILWLHHCTAPTRASLITLL